MSDVIKKQIRGIFKVGDIITKHNKGKYLVTKCGAGNIMDITNLITRNTEECYVNINDIFDLYKPKVNRHLPDWMMK